MNNNQIKVWDIGVRVFHWALVLIFSVAWLTGEESENIHSWAGYIVLGLVGFRVIWGLVGTKYARFSNFIYSPKRIGQYLKSLTNDQPEHYAGHNPAAGLMVILLLLNLLLISWTGLEAWGAEGHGPLAQMTEVQVINQVYASSVEGNKNDAHEDEDEEYWEEWHEFFTNLMLIFVVVHVLGVIISSKLHKENLIKAMVTGYKSKK